MKKLTTLYVKKEYDRQLKAEHGDYEFNRWFKNPENKLGYDMHYSSQRFHTKGIEFKSYFEFGVGPGTWTKMFLSSSKRFVLLDISEEMIKQAKQKIGNGKNMRYITGNVLNLNQREKFDFVFSSRAIKYIPNKEKLFRVIYSSLRNGGKCVIISQSIDTLMQRLYRLLGIKERDALHTGGITIKELKKILLEAGFKDVKFYPVEIKVGIPSVVIFKGLSSIVWNIFYKHELNWLSTFLSGSYLVKMRK